MELIDQFAIAIVSGMCAGDWKFNMLEGESWDETAARRAYQIANAVLLEKKLNDEKETT
jgi:hypothetical protein